MQVFIALVNLKIVCKGILAFFAGKTLACLLIAVIREEFKLMD